MFGYVATSQMNIHVVVSKNNKHATVYYVLAPWGIYVNISIPHDY